MVTAIRIYFEGDAKLRPGFNAFFSEITDTVREMRCTFKLVATNATPGPDYIDGSRRNPKAWNLLLLDSDGPITSDLLERKGLAQSDEGSVFWMVQVMDPGSLRTRRGWRATLA